MVGNLQQRLHSMWKDDIMTDVTVIVQGHQFRCHRTVLGSCGGPLRDLLETKAELIEIKDDIAPNTFLTLLDCLYRDECTIDERNVFELMHAAETFGLQGLEYQCAQEIKTKLAATNVGIFTAQALHFDAKEVLKVCQDYFRENTSEVIYAKEFVDISIEALEVFCSIEDISCSKADFFDSVMKWAESECYRKNLQGTPAELRQVLGRSLKNIKFSEMPLEDFLEFVVPSDILSSEEVGETIISRQKSKAPKLLRNWSERIGVRVKIPLRQGFFRFQIYYSTINIPLSTRIRDLKQMKIFDQGTKRCPPDTFTLKHKQKALADDMTLASIYTPGEELLLNVDSLTVTVQEATGKWEMSVPLKGDMSWTRNYDMIKAYIQLYHNIHPDKTDITFKCHDEKLGFIFRAS